LAGLLPIALTIAKPSGKSGFSPFRCEWQILLPAILSGTVVPHWDTSVAYPLHNKSLSLPSPAWFTNCRAKGELALNPSSIRLYGSGTGTADASDMAKPMPNKNT
jgi:hypothetical protein